MKSKAILITTACTALFAFTSCEKKSPAEEAADDIGDAVEEVADEVGDAVRNAD